MEYCTLGRSGIKVSRYCFGSLTLGPLCANLALEQGGELLLMALNRGVSFIDTAEQYLTYPYISYALERFEQRDNVVVASKTFAETAEQLSWALEDTRLALRRNQLDIFLLHELRDMEDWHSRTAAWQALEQAKRNSYVRAIGISTHSAAVAAWAAAQAEIDIIHPLLNSEGIGIRDGGRAEMLAAISLAKQSGKGVYSMKALAGGALMNRAKQALLWAWQQPELDAVAIGCRDRAELMTNLGWLAGEDPPEAEEIKLIRRSMAFDKEPRCHGCGKCVEKCPNGAMLLVNGQAEWQRENCLFCGYCIAACPWFCLSFC